MTDKRFENLGEEEQSYWRELAQKYSRGEISSGAAAESLGTSRVQFLKSLGYLGLPMSNMTTEDLEEDIRFVRVRRAQRELDTLREMLSDMTVASGKEAAFAVLAVAARLASAMEKIDA